MATLPALLDTDILSAIMRQDIAVIPKAFKTGYSHDFLLTCYPSYSTTIELLHDRANNDPNEKVREFARQKSAELEEQK